VLRQRRVHQQHRPPPGADFANLHFAPKVVGQIPQRPRCSSEKVRGIMINGVLTQSDTF
jgi:hypothetical protein